MLDISPKNFMLLKNFNSELSYIELWFTNQNSKPLQIEDKIAEDKLAACQKLFDHAKKSAAHALKTASKRVVQKTAKTAQATGDLIGNKIANKITRVSKNSHENNSETVTNQHGYEVPKERERYLQKHFKILLMN